MLMMGYTHVNGSHMQKKLERVCSGLLFKSKGSKITNQSNELHIRPMFSLPEAGVVLCQRCSDYGRFYLTTVYCIIREDDSFDIK